MTALGCRDIVVHVTNPASVFQNLEKQIRLYNERYNERKYLFLLHNNESQSIEDLLQVPELDYVSDVLIIVPEYRKEDTTVRLDVSPSSFYETYRLVTYRFVGIDRGYEIIFLDKWFSENCSFLYDNELYPDKTSNQNGKPLRISAFNYAPYSVIGKYKSVLLIILMIYRVARPK